MSSASNNYAFHKKFFKRNSRVSLLTPSGGLIEPPERTLISGFIDFLSSDFDQRAALQNAAEMYLSSVGISRSRDMALLKHFESFRGGQPFRLALRRIPDA